MVGSACPNQATTERTMWPPAMAWPTSAAGHAAAHGDRSRRACGCVSTVSVAGQANSSTIKVTVAHSRCPNGSPVVRVEDETDQRIILRAEHDVRQSCDDIGLLKMIDVALTEPVGERRVSVEPANPILQCSISGRPNRACRKSRSSRRRRQRPSTHTRSVELNAGRCRGVHQYPAASRCHIWENGLE